MLTMYGIKNCDTIKKARKWLDDAGIDYQFHDYKQDGLTPDKADNLLKALGHEALINKRGTTWRQLSDEIKAGMNDTLAKQVMLDNPSIIKRPLLETADGQQLLGFKAADYEQFFAQAK